MNNIKRIIIIIIMGIVFIPSTVYGVATDEKVTRKSVARYESKAVERVTPQSETAAEIPTDGVTYFLIYPNGHEVATESYDEAMNPPEIVIYEGDTNESGEVLLDEVISTGQLRIVEDVPTGYTTNQREILLDLEDSNVAQFVNHRGFVNPQTGTSILFVVFIIALAVVVALYLKNKVKKVNAAGVVVLIVALTFVGYRSLNVNAAAVKQAAVAKEAPLIAPTKDLLPRKKLVISVNDSYGKSMKQVRVKVYAKPLRVESSPAIKFSANGGTFFDGTTLMYFRLPYDGCTETEFYASLTIPNREYLNQNRSLATRPGFVLADKVASERERERDILRREIVMAAEEKRYYNGQIINLEWLQSNNSHVTTYHLNGGILPFNDKNLTSFKREMAYTAIEQELIFSEFTSNIKGSNYLVGLSTDEQCSEYAPYGVKTVAEDGLNLSKKDISLKRPTDYYFCWNKKPDGIYINDVLFVGNTDSCFNTSDYLYNGNMQQFINTKNRADTFMITKNLDDNVVISYLYHDGRDLVGNKDELVIKAFPADSILKQRTLKEDEEVKKRVLSDAVASVKSSLDFQAFDEIREQVSEKINSIKIVYHGEDIVSLSDKDMVCDDDAKTCIINDSKAAKIKDYITSLKSKCNKKEDEVKVIEEDRVAKEAREVK